MQKSSFFHLETDFYLLRGLDSNAVMLGRVHFHLHAFSLDLSHNLSIKHKEREKEGTIRVALRARNQFLD